MSLLDIVKTHEKKLKSFGIVKAEELRKMKAGYENFVLAYHRGGIDGFRKYSNYTLTRPFWSIVYNYHFSITNTASKNKFLQQVVEPYLDLVWRQWDSPKLQSKFDEVKEKAAKAQALKQEREEALAAMPSYLEGLTSDQYLAFHEQALRILNRDKKKLSESSGILKVDIEHRYQPLLKLLKETRDIEDSLDAKIRQGIDFIIGMIQNIMRHSINLKDRRLIYRTSIWLLLRHTKFYFLHILCHMFICYQIDYHFTFILCRKHIKES